MANKEDIFREMSNNASESDIRRIDENIDGMKRGKLAEVWDKVMQLYRFVKDPNAPWGGKALAIGPERHAQSGEPIAAVILCSERDAGERESLIFGCCSPPERLPPAC